MKIIGLTGSIAMGKSVTSKMFLAQNIPVFDSDQAVHQLLGHDGAAVKMVDKAFPGNKKNNQIDRSLLAKCVFNNDDALKTLEDILHPMVQEMRHIFLKTAQEKGHDLVLFDIPLLFEKNHQDSCDYVIVVSADGQIQKKRALERPGMTEQRLLSILKKQTPDQEKRSRADFIILTDQGLDYAEKQVKNILQEIRQEIRNK